MDSTYQFYQLLVGAPVYIVWTVGIVLCISQMHRNSRVCTLILVAIGIFAVTGFPMENFYETVVGYFQPTALDPDSIWFWLVYFLPHTILHTIAWGLILWAIFGPKGLIPRPYDIEHADGIDQS